MSITSDRMPAKIVYAHYGNNYNEFIDAVYDVFDNDFIKQKTSFGSHVLKLKFQPILNERAYTFYHMTHKGPDEQNRTPDIKRSEFMSWAKPTSERTSLYNLKFWEQERKGNKRICIWVEVDDDYDYFVVLDIRKTFLLLWTAFIGEYKHEINKKKKEYNNWCQSVGFKIFTPDELVNDIQAKLP